MIVKFLYRKSTSFPGVCYNTDKIEKDKGELVKVSGFGALQGLDHLRPADYINYLEAVSARSKRIKYPQLHAVISCKGKSHTKEQLTGIASKWLKGMGYGEQPYMLVFHKDTKNNHIHMVTTRIGREGKKIDDSFEKLKAYQVLNRVMGVDENQVVHADIEKALSYNFSTRAQLMMILEAQGYVLKLDNDGYKVIKFGKELTWIPLEKVDKQIEAYQKDKARIAQLRAIIERYRQQNDPTIHPIMRPLPGDRAQVRIGYTSKLSKILQEKFGVEVIFHAKDEKPPYGYTFLDHATKQIFKGGEIMDLKAFIAPDQNEPSKVNLHLAEIMSSDYSKGETEEQKLAGNNQTTYSPDIIPEPSNDVYEVEPISIFTGFQLDIADDIDDEQILGRNRRRKRKARTNTR